MRSPLIVGLLVALATAWGAWLFVQQVGRPTDGTPLPSLGGSVRHSAETSGVVAGPRGEVLGEEGSVVPSPGVVDVDPRDPILSRISSRVSTVRAIPASVPGDGVSEVTVVVTARTEEGELVAGAQANLESSRGVQDDVEVIQGRTSYDGQAVFVVRSKDPGTAIFRAHFGTRPVDQMAVVRFTPPPTLTLSLPPNLIVAVLAFILLILFTQYMFVRTLLDARRSALHFEEELAFHHPSQSKGVK